MITTRLPVADIADHEGSSVLRRNLEQLSSDGGEQLLRALGVKGDQAELRSASNEFSGHCLALTLLGGYLTDAYHGDIRFRKEVSKCLAYDVRQENVDSDYLFGNFLQRLAFIPSADCSLMTEHLSLRADTDRSS